MVILKLQMILPLSISGDVSEVFHVEDGPKALISTPKSNKPLLWNPKVCSLAIANVPLIITFLLPVTKLVLTQACLFPQDPVYIFFPDQHIMRNVA